MTRTGRGENADEDANANVSAGGARRGRAPLVRCWRKLASAGAFGWLAFHGWLVAASSISGSS